MLPPLAGHVGAGGGGRTEYFIQKRFLERKLNWRRLCLEPVPLTLEQAPPYKIASHQVTRTTFNSTKCFSAYILKH